MLVEKLIQRHPTIYHMAEAGSWDSIRARGLLSTTAALDHLGIGPGERERFESEHRAQMMTAGRADQGGILLRDQKPMPPSRLEKALPAGVSVADWYRLINGKVFFWVQEERLMRLLKSYGNEPHDVLEVDTASLLKAHAGNVSLCRMNSGNTLPFPHPRTPGDFQRIADYEVRANGTPIKPIVELVVDYHVPDIADHVRAVRRMQGDRDLGILWKR